MRRKISFEFIILILTALVAFTIGATFFARSSINSVTELNLEKYLEIIKIDYQNLDQDKIIEKYQDLDNYLRITFIDSSGTVTQDTLADELNNHLDRPEIINLGKSYIRYSETLRIDMMYLASQLNNGEYIRVAIPTASVLGFLNDFIALSIIIGIVIVVLSIMSSSYMIKQSLLPLSDIKHILSDLNNGKYKEIIPITKYEEINGFIKEINEVNKNISSNITSLKLEKLKSDFLLNHMNQGICVLNEEKKIILLNSYLKDLYHFNIDFNINKDYRYLFRDEEIQKGIIKTYEEKNGRTMFTQVDDLYYSVSIIYSDKDWGSSSTVILIYSDITATKNIEILKRDFFINASHELKSPLTTIIGSAELISRKIVVDQETIMDLIKRITSEANRMNNLVMDMLSLSEYETKYQNKNKIIINLEKIVNDVVNNLAFLSSEKDINITSNVEKSNILMSYEELYQLIKNLVENAIKYGKTKGNVWIEMYYEQSDLVLSVKDDGIGIPQKDLNRIFERFYRVDKARSKSTGGTGLGLSIVKHIVLNYNGHIDISSEEGEGTEIKIFLPKVEIETITG